MWSGGKQHWCIMTRVTRAIEQLIKNGMDEKKAVNQIEARLTELKASTPRKAGRPHSSSWWKHLADELTPPKKKDAGGELHT